MQEGKKIWLIRHGETAYNLEGKLQGSRVDTDLNQTGKKQAEAFFNKYQNIGFDKIYISPFKRTYQSVFKFIQKGIFFEKHAALNEIDWGPKDGKICDLQGPGSYLFTIQEWDKGNMSQKMEGGETPLEVQARQRKFLELIISRPDEKEILICMHGRAMRIMLSTMLNTPLDKMKQYKHNNLGLYILHYASGIFEIEVNNDTSHLAEIRSIDAVG